MTFEMLTGQRPFPNAGSRRHVAAPHPNRCRRRATSVRTCHRSPRRRWWRARWRLSPDDRFQSTTALAQALGAAASPVSPGVETVAAPADSGHRRGDAHGSPLPPRRWLSTVRASSGCVVRARPPRRHGWALMTGQRDARANVRAVARGAAVRERRRCRGRLLRPRRERRAGESPDERRRRARDVAEQHPRVPQHDEAARPDRPRARRRLPARRTRPMGSSRNATAHRVRVTVELVRSRDGSSVWADRYEAKTRRPVRHGRPDRREGGRRAGGRARRTRAAHDFGPADRRTSRHTPISCAARRSASRRRTRSTTRRVPSQMFERAVALDPKFALAFARLAKTHGDIYWANTDRTAKRLALDARRGGDSGAPRSRSPRSAPRARATTTSGASATTIAPWPSSRRRLEAAAWEWRGVLGPRCRAAPSGTASPRRRRTWTRAVELDPRSPQLPSTLPALRRNGARVSRRRALPGPDPRTQPALGGHLRRPWRCSFRRWRGDVAAATAFLARRHGVAGRGEDPRSFAVQGRDVRRIHRAR